MNAEVEAGPELCHREQAGALSDLPFHRSYFGKLFLAFAMIVVASAVALGLLIHSRLSKDSLAEIERNLDNTSLLLASAEGANPTHLWSDLLPMQLREIGQQTGYHLRLIHANGVVAADSHLDASAIPNQRGLPAFIEARRAGISRQGAQSPIDGEPMLIQVRPILVSSDLIGYVQIGTSLSGHANQLEHMRLRIAVAATLNAAAVLILGYFAGRHATRPLAQIAAACQRIDAGDLEAQVQVRRRDEFGTVAEAINRMVNGLKRQIYTITREREQLNRALAENRRLETVRQTFVANVSHELKTPLTAISSIIDTLVSHGSIGEADRSRFHHRIRGQTERLKRLVFDLLTLSQLESDHAALDHKPVDLKPVVEQAASVFRPIALAKGLRFECILPEGEVRIRGDAESIRVMVNNLLQNAVAYTPAAGLIRLILETVGPDTAALLVSDTGIGIAAEHQSRVFERFYRVDRARSRNSGGTGLGLSIVKHIAIAHQGHVSLQSEPNRGSCFRVALPLLQSEVSANQSKGCEAILS